MAIITKRSRIDNHSNCELPPISGCFNRIPDRLIALVATWFPFQPRTRELPGKGIRTAMFFAHPMKAVHPYIERCIELLRNHNRSNPEINMNKQGVCMDITHLLSSTYIYHVISFCNFHVTKLRFMDGSTHHHFNRLVYLVGKDPNPILGVKHVTFSNNCSDAVDAFMREKFDSELFKGVFEYVEDVTVPLAVTGWRHILEHYPWRAKFTLHINGLATIPGNRTHPIDTNHMRCEGKAGSSPTSGSCQSVGLKYIPCGIDCVYKGVVHDCKSHGQLSEELERCICGSYLHKACIKKLNASKVVCCAVDRQWYSRAEGHAACINERYIKCETVACSVFQHLGPRSPRSFRCRDCLDERNELIVINPDEYYVICMYRMSATSKRTRVDCNSTHSMSRSALSLHDIPAQIIATIATWLPFKPISMQITASQLDPNATRLSLYTRVAEYECWSHPMNQLSKHITHCIDLLRTYNPSAPHEANINKQGVCMDITQLITPRRLLTSLLNWTFHVTQLRFMKGANRKYIDCLTELDSGPRVAIRGVKHVVFSGIWMTPLILFLKGDARPLKACFPHLETIRLSSRLNYTRSLLAYDPTDSPFTLYIDGLGTYPGKFPTCPSDIDHMKCEGKTEGPAPIQCSSTGAKYIPCGVECLYKGLVRNCPTHSKSSLVIAPCICCGIHLHQLCMKSVVYTTIDCWCPGRPRTHVAIQGHPICIDGEYKHCKRNSCLALIHKTCYTLKDTCSECRNVVQLST